MPVYRITAPNGVTYQTVGPPGATPEQIKAVILRAHPEAGVPPQEENTLEKIPLIGGLAAGIADLPLEAASMLAGVGKAGAEAFGADNAVSDFFGDIAEGARDWKSSGAREDALASQIDQQMAQGRGTWEEIKAAGRSFLRSPLETTAGVAGSAIPFIAAGALTGGAAVPALMGAVIGAGTIKGEVQDAVYSEFKKAGASEEQALAAAEKAQEYSGQNLDQIGFGAVLGAVASATGFAPAIAKTIGARASARVAERIAAREAAEAAGEQIARKSLIRGGAEGIVKEALPESVQGGQEKYASNLALQREGFDVDPWAGVAGQAAAEGIASIFLGGYGGVRETKQENVGATIKQYAAKVEALPDDPTEEDIASMAEWAKTRGYSDDEAEAIAKNAAEKKATVTAAKRAKEEADAAAMKRYTDLGFNEETARTIVGNAQLQKEAEARVAAAEAEAKQKAREERTAGVEPIFEPDIGAPPPVDAEEQAAMERAYAAEAGTAPTIIPPLETITPQAQISEQLAEIGVAPPTPDVFANPPTYPTGGDLTPERANAILDDQDALDEYVNRGGDIETLQAVAREEDVGYQPKYSRGRRPKDTQTASLGFDLPVQMAPGEDLKRDEYNELRFASDEEKAAREQQFAEEMQAGQERALAINEREAGQRQRHLDFIQSILRAKAPENAVYKVLYEPEDTNAPYKLVAETQLGKKPELVLQAKTRQDFSDAVYERMEELTPYTPPAPAGIEEIEERESGEQKYPTVATRMVQDFTAEVDAAREAGQIDNLQRSELLQRLQRPNAYRTLPNGRQVPNDAIAKLEAKALEAASVLRNAPAEEQEAAKAAVAEANKKLRAAVKNSLLNPARAKLKSMVEMRQDEKLGAKVRIKEAERAERVAARDMRKEMKPGKGVLEADVTPERARVQEAKKEKREAKIDLKESKVQKYRKAERKGGVEASVVQRVVDKITKQWKSTNPIVVVQSISDIPDAKVRRAIERDGAMDAEGLVAPDGTIYLIADNLDGESRAKAVLFHEGLGHVGLEKLFREKLDSVLNALYKGNAKLRAETDAWMKANPDAYKDDADPLARAVEEVLAERSEAGQLEPSIFNRLASIVRNFARRLGINLALSDADVDAILAAAHERTVNGPNESQLVKGMRYVGGDRVVIDAEAAKTFLKELGLFTNRELMSMPKMDAIRRAHNIGVDQEWLDYYRSRRLAARAPEGAEPIKLPQPDMSQYMPKLPKFSRKKKVVDAASGLSAGRRRVEDTMSVYGMVDGIEEATENTSKLRDAIAFDEGTASPVRQKALFSMPTSGITGWLQRKSPAVYEVAEVLVDTVRKMNGLRVNLMAAGDDIVRDMKTFVRKNGSGALARAQFTNRINEIDFLAFDTMDEALAKHRLVKAIEGELLSNSNNKAETRKLIDAIKEQAAKESDDTSVLKDKVNLSPALRTKANQLSKVAVDADGVMLKVKQLAAVTQRIRDSYAAKAELAKQKGGLELYEAEREYHKRILEARQALLDERIERGLGKEEAVRIRDIRARMMREMQSPTERQKAGDLFWDLDADLFDKEYFPMLRDGQYWLRVKEDLSKGREEQFYVFESARELAQGRRKLAKMLKEDPESGEIFESGNDIGELQNTLRESDTLMQRVFDIVGTARDEYVKNDNIDMRQLMDEIYQTWLMTTPERSARRHFMHAKQIAGFSVNTLGNLQSQLITNANELTKLAYAGRVRTATKAIKDTINDVERPVSEKSMLGDFARELELRAEQELNPPERGSLNTFVNALNRFSFYYYLTSAKTALTNFANIPMRVVPRFWREYGYAEGTAMWIKYMKMWDSLGRVKIERTDTGFGDFLDTIMPNVNGSNFVKNNEDLQWALKAGTERGILMTTADTMVHNTRANPLSLQGSLTGKLEDLNANVGKVMSFLFTGTENISRQATFYMAFELEMKKQAKENPSMPREQRREIALQKAMRIVDDTIGNFADWERPRIAKGEATRAFFLFKMHPILQTKFMVGAFRDIIAAPLRGAARQATGRGKMTKEDTAYMAGALKEFSGVIMMGALLGGVTGLPLYTIMLQMLAEGFDEEDDDDVRKLLGIDPRTAYDADLMFKAWVMEHLGTPEKGDVDFADIVLGGVPGAMTDTELAGTLTLDLVSMWYREPIAGDSLESTAISALIANVAGFSMVSQMLKAWEDVEKENTSAALKKLLPAFFRAPVAAYYSGEEGIKTRKGDIVIPKEDITGGDIARSVLGARSARLARWQDYYITAKKNEDRIKGEKVDILDQLERKIDSGEIATEKDFNKFWTETVVPFNRTYPDPDLMITMDSIERSLTGRAERESRTMEGMLISKKSPEQERRSAEPFRVK